MEMKFVAKVLFYLCYFTFPICTLWPYQDGVIQCCIWSIKV